MDITLPTVQDHWKQSREHAELGQGCTLQALSARELLLLPFLLEPISPQQADQLPHLSQSHF